MALPRPGRAAAAYRSIPVNMSLPATPRPSGNPHVDVDHSGQTPWRAYAGAVTGTGSPDRRTWQIWPVRDDHEDDAEIHARVDALLTDLTARRMPLPLPAERRRLRQAAGLTSEQVADVLQCEGRDIEAWEAGSREPLGTRRAGYARLLDGLTVLEKSRTDTPKTASKIVPQPPAAPALTEPELPEQLTFPPATRAPAVPPAAVTRSRTPRRATFPAGPVAVVDHGTTLTAHFADGTCSPVVADSVLDVVSWALDAGIGRARLNDYDRDGDPLVVLTPSATEFLGLPPVLEDRAQLRLPERHPEVTLLRDGGFKLTRRGFGPWARVYQPVKNGKRASVQLAVTSWGALSQDGWNLPPMQPADLAQLLGIYAERVLTPRGSTAVCGQELMTALRPPTKPQRDETGSWASAANPGALWKPIEPAPPEAPDAHPLAQGRSPQQALDEEAWDWRRPPTDDEVLDFTHVVGLDINLAFVAAASNVPVGLNAVPEHVVGPAFNKKIPGSWLCDLSQNVLEPRLPSPFTPTGEPPTGPAWYATPTLAYAEELGITVRPIEAYLREGPGPYLTPWYERLRDAYLATMNDLGVRKNMAQADFLDAMKALRTADPALLALLAAIKATGKGGIGKLREGPRDITAPYQPWPALDSPTWRPDIRAAVVSRARVTLHRKMRKMLTEAGRSPLAVLSDCVLYAARRPTALDVVPAGPDRTGIAGLLRLGVNPGYAKEEGVQSMSWYQHQYGQGVNPARSVKEPA